MTRPTLVFKQKTPDGGERNLDNSPQNCVVVKDDNGSEKRINLSQPVSYLRLSAIELTAVFNHPSINKHGKATFAPIALQNEPKSSTEHVIAAEPATRIPTTTADWNGPALTIVAHPGPPVQTDTPVVQLSDFRPGTQSACNPVPAPPLAAAPVAGEETPDRSQADRQVAKMNTQEFLPNLWLKSVLAQPSIRFDWLSCLLYDAVAEHFGNSNQGQLGPMSCWAVALTETEDIADNAFKGIFLTEKHGLGFLSLGHMIRFYKGVAFIGTEVSALEGIGIDLVAVGIDAQQRIVFIVMEDYRDKFDEPERTVTEELSRLTRNGAQMMTAAETLNSPMPLEVVWTVPADQENPADPQPLQSIAPLGAIEP